ncbi:MAG: hypothetical protein IAI50_02610 [Candidatus Eremiobacteraeota bacterium]|nr:hypothetical protein [Candidatus Eremiobacteraeota bacterium]
MPKLAAFDAPGAATVSSKECRPYCGTVPSAIDAAGIITGFYTDKYIVPHGFILSSGNFISFDAPGAGRKHGSNEGTVPLNINNHGAIAGQFESAEQSYHGFIRQPNGDFMIVEAPGAGTGRGKGTIVTSINDYGAYAGYYIDSRRVGHGFVGSAYGLLPFDPPGSIFTYVCFTQCINASGAVVGYFEDAKHATHGFVRMPSGTIRVIDAPQARLSYVTGINNDGVLSGNYADQKYAYSSFVFSKGKFTIYKVAGAGTVANTIDASGAETGEYFTRDHSPNIGYYRTAQGAVETFSASGAGSRSRQGTIPVAMNATGTETGYYSDSAGLQHGFIVNR